MRNGLILRSNYRSGLRIFDAYKPLQPVEFCDYDTYPEDDLADFDGIWSSYAYFPSGTVVGSDLNRGLWVWRVPAMELPSR